MKTNFNLMTMPILLIGILAITSCIKIPEACYTVDKGKTAKVNEEVQFDATCSKNTTTYTWDFGDNTTASGVIVKHKFSTAKTYSIKLTIANSKSTVVNTQDLQILP
jgi:PKD repeat protein